MSSVVTDSLGDTGRIRVGAKFPGSPPALSPAFTVALAIVLFGPFVARVLSNTEPYPAILLPSGAGKIAIRGHEATFEHLTLYTNDSAGRLVSVDPRRLLAPIPTHYLDAIATNDFGQSEASTQSIIIRRLGAYSIPRRRPAEADRAVAREWLLERLREVDPSARDLVVRLERSTLDLDNVNDRSITVREKDILLR